MSERAGSKSSPRAAEPNTARRLTPKRRQMSAIAARRSAISGSMAIASHEGRLGDCGVGEDARSGAHGTPPAAFRHLAGKAGPTSAECPSRPSHRKPSKPRVRRARPGLRRSSPMRDAKTATESDHYVQVEQPELVVEAIRALGAVPPLGADERRF